jgi:hypothetical protein
LGLLEEDYTMFYARFLKAVASTGLLVGLSVAGALAASDEELIKEAESAGPAGVAKNAAIMAFNEDGTHRTLREGTNNFTCMADDPSPGHNPMCLDQNAMA